MTTWRTIRPLIFALLLAAAAGFFDAVRDTLDHHFDTSVFKGLLNAPFWNPLHPENDNVTRIFSYPVDAWHLCKSAMLCCAFAVYFFRGPWWGYFLIGVTYIGSFNLFYDIILR